MMVSKRNLLFQGLLFRFHVKFQGCKDIIFDDIRWIFLSAESCAGGLGIVTIMGFMVILFEAAQLIE